MHKVFPICTRCKLWWVGGFKDVGCANYVFPSRICANWGMGEWVSPNWHIVQIGKTVRKNGRPPRKINVYNDLMDI